MPLPMRNKWYHWIELNSMHEANRNIWKKLQSKKKNRHPIRRNDKRSIKCNRAQKKCNKLDERQKTRQRNVHSSISNELLFSCTNLLNSFINAIDLIRTFTHHRQPRQQQQQTASRITTQFTNHVARWSCVPHSHCVCVCIQSFPRTFNILGGAKIQFDFISNCDRY